LGHRRLARDCRAKGIPADVHKTLVSTLKKVYDSKDYKDFMASRGFGVVWADPEGTAKFMAKSDSDLGAALKASASPSNVKVNDAVTGAALLALAAVLLWHIQGFPEMPGQKFGPAWFPGLIAIASGFAARG